MSTPISAPAGTPKRKSPAAKVIALAIGLPCMGCFLLGACVMVLAFLPGKNLPVRADDESVVLRASNLEPWITTKNVEVDEAFSKIERSRSLFGVEQIEYEYQRAGEVLFVNSTATIDPKVDDARTTFDMTKFGLGVGVAIEKKDGMKKVERNDLFSWGDESAAYVLEIGGDPVGNAVVARKGNRTFFVIFAGVYFEDADDLAEVLEPHLNALEAWSP